jgi:uncharacterized protein (TIGR04255 family)
MSVELNIDLGQPEQPLLRQAPLRLVLCQLRFPKIFGLSRKDVRPFARGVADDYPVADVDQMQPVEFQISPGGIRQTQGMPQPVYKFQAEDGKWTVTLTEDWLALETTAYEGFRDFIGRWHRIAIEAQSAFELDRESRLGIRYVNELALGEVSAAELRECLSSEVLGPLNLDEAAESLQRSWQEVRLRYLGNEGCTMQHGYVQNAEEEWVYVLDFDAYREGNRTLDLEDQAKGLAALNHRVFGLFQRSVTPDAFNRFEPEAQ